MRTDEGQFTGQAGVPIHWQAWLPDDEPRAVLVVAVRGSGPKETPAKSAWPANLLAGKEASPGGGRS